MTNPETGFEVKVVEYKNGQQHGYKYRNGEYVGHVSADSATASANAARQHDEARVEIEDFERTDEARVPAWLPDGQGGEKEVEISMVDARLVGTTASRVKNGELNADQQVIIEGETYRAGDVARVVEKKYRQTGQLFVYES